MTTRFRRYLGLALGVVALATTPRAAFAQSANASMLIDVRDSSNAPVPDVVVFVINEENGLTRRGTTSSNGTFAVDRLPTGSYTLTAARDGFKPEVLQNLRLLTSVKAIVPITLTAGQYNERVVVNADATSLRIGNSAVGDVFDSDTLLTLPTREREALAFATQAAGWRPRRRDRGCPRRETPASTAPARARRPTISCSTASTTTTSS